jgi:protein gp37
MSDKTCIEWTRSDDGTPGATWNPVTGCTKVSAGCDHCYAETFAERWRGIPGHYFERGFDVTLRPDKLEQPLRWARPRRIFVNSMSDLFHDSVPTAYIAAVFDVMRRTPQHTYQLLTKRHARMRSLARTAVFGEGWPLPNVWLGCSVEDQHWADIRIPALLDTPAAVRFLSCEPLLGPVTLPFITEHDGCTCGGYGPPYYVHERSCGTEPGPAWGNLSWVIAGGESGPGARPMELEWARSLVRQCREAGTAVFVKQLGSVLGRELGAGPKGGNWDAWPEDLKVREFPRAAEAVAA